VVGVSDGDTITVLDDAKVQHKIRFAGIDAPEKGQPFGERSKQNLSALVFQKAGCHKKDRYGRRDARCTSVCKKGRSAPEWHGELASSVAAIVPSLLFDGTSLRRRRTG
jgi:endonuclease YncB( thermonuclease family)